MYEQNNIDRTYSDKEIERNIKKETERDRKRKKPD